MSQSDPHRDEPVLLAGPAIAEARRAFLLLHGRGASAEDILSIAIKLADADTALIAPQAAQHTWYPNSFLAPIDQNQPWLDSAIAKIRLCVAQCIAAGINTDQIAIVGFSQGACLATEFVARNPARYCAVIAFTGGLLGPPGMDLSHTGNLQGTPILLSSGDPDPHVPWQRVQESAIALEEMGGSVRAMRYANRPHTILQEELQTAKTLLAGGLFSAHSG
jgi:predicted esterase